MTDRSSQPTSSDDTSSLSSQKIGSRRFTVTLGKKTIGNIVSKDESIDLQGSSSSSNMSVNDKLSTNTSISASNKAKTIPIIKEKPLLEIPQHIDYPDSHKPAVVHALFDPKRIKVDPNRSLSDIPEPAPRKVLEDETAYEMFSRFDKELSNSKVSVNDRLCEQQTISDNYISAVDNRKYEESALKSLVFDENASKWSLIQSPALADHLALLSAGGLVELPNSFYYNSSVRPLLASLKDMRLVDMSQIQITIEQLLNDVSSGVVSGYKGKISLMRQGLISKQKEKNNPNELKQQTHRRPTADDIDNLELASEWESILHPDRFDSDEMDYSNLTTDIMATSVTLHALAQCPTRKSINYKLTATDIAKYLRSYLLSQCNLTPSRREYLKHIHIYAGHVIVVAKILGWQMECITESNSMTGKQKVEVVFNISSRCGLFTRYPLLDEYYINGWSV